MPTLLGFAPDVTLTWNGLLPEIHLWNERLKNPPPLPFLQFPWAPTILYIFIKSLILSYVRVKGSLLVKWLQDGHLSFYLQVTTKYVKLPCTEHSRPECRIPTDYESSSVHSSSFYPLHWHLLCLLQLDLANYIKNNQEKVILGCVSTSPIC